MDDHDPPVRPERLSTVFDLVGPLYRQVYRKVDHDTSREGLSVGVRAVLVMLHARGPMTVPQMGRAQALSRQFLQRMVNEASARGLAESVPNPAHKRSRLIRLTDEGRRLVEALRGRELAMLGPAAADLTDADVDVCLRVLSRLLALFDDVAVE
jgi:DNA-binding MarR family transcriptional regulator